MIKDDKGNKLKGYRRVNAKEEDKGEKRKVKYREFSVMPSQC